MLELLKKLNIDENYYIIKNYKKNDIIFNESQSLTKIGFIEKGIIKIITNTYLDNEYEIARLSKDNFFGDNLLFNNNHITQGTCISLTECKIIYFTKDNFLKALKNTSFLEYYLNLKSLETIKMKNKIKILSQHSIKEKILFLLYNNYKTNNNKVFHFKNKIVLANYINCPRPSLSRVLIELKQDGIIDYDKNTITLK